jgi:hypothetical protein
MLGELPRPLRDLGILYPARGGGVLALHPDGVLPFFRSPDSSPLPEVQFSEDANLDGQAWAGR